MNTPRGYWPSRWPGEDGGPQRRQVPVDGGDLGLRARGGGRLEVVHRPGSNAGVATMVVLRNPGEAYLLCHTGGDDAVSWVEQIDPVTLRTLRRSPSLEGGPTWPGGIACHENGSLYVVFGRHAHRLSADLDVIATTRLPRERPYNSFVILADGHLALKDFGGLRPGQTESDGYEGTEVVVLEPDQLQIVARRLVPEPSIARLSADAHDVWVVGDTSLWHLRWAGGALTLDPGYRALYRTTPGQSYGWDPVLENGAAWFHDNGAGTERFSGTLRGLGLNTAPSHLVHIHLVTGEVTMTEIAGSRLPTTAAMGWSPATASMAAVPHRGCGRGRSTMGPIRCGSSRANWCCATTTSIGVSNRWWYSTSRPVASTRVRTPAARCSRCCSPLPDSGATSTW